MIVKCISGDRDMILRVMQRELNAPAAFQPLPAFSYSVGGYVLRRDGTIETAEDGDRLFSALAALELCDYPLAPAPADPGDIAYPMAGHTGTSLMNLVSMFSARQSLINRALDAKGAFGVAPALMCDLAAHPPLSVADFLRAVYGREQELRGLRFSRETIALTGFRRGHAQEAQVHRQLADLMLRAALSQAWTKPFTRSTANKKYAFRIWLNAIGMTGPEYEAARRLMLARLPGRSDRRAMPRRREG